MGIRPRQHSHGEGARGHREQRSLLGGGRRGQGGRVGAEKREQGLREGGRNEGRRQCGRRRRQHKRRSVCGRDEGRRRPRQRQRRGWGNRHKCSASRGSGGGSAGSTHEGSEAGGGGRRVRKAAPEIAEQAVVQAPVPARSGESRESPLSSCACCSFTRMRSNIGSLVTPPRLNPGMGEAGGRATPKQCRVGSRCLPKTKKTDPRRAAARRTRPQSMMSACCATKRSASASHMAPSVAPSARGRASSKQLLTRCRRIQRSAGPSVAVDGGAPLPGGDAEGVAPETVGPSSARNHTSKSSTRDAPSSEMLELSSLSLPIWTQAKVGKAMHTLATALLAVPALVSAVPAPGGGDAEQAAHGAPRVASASSTQRRRPRAICGASKQVAEGAAMAAPGVVPKPAGALSKLAATPVVCATLPAGGVVGVGSAARALAAHASEGHTEAGRANASSETHGPSGAAPAAGQADDARTSSSGELTTRLSGAATREAAR